MSLVGAARAVLAASGVVAAFVALLPATLAILIALFDVSAHGLLGMSGTLLGLATPFGSGDGLATFRGVSIDLPRAILVSALRGLPPIGMIVLAARPGTRTRWTLASVCGSLAVLTAGWAAAPGLVAGLGLMLRANKNLGKQKPVRPDPPAIVR